MLAISYEVTKWLQPIDVTKDGMPAEASLVYGYSGSNVRSFSCRDVQGLAWGRITFVSNDDALQTFDQVNLLEFYDNLLDACQKGLSKGEKAQCLFPSSNYALTFMPNAEVANSVSIALDEIDVKRCFEITNMDMIAFYRSTWRSNMEILNKLHDYQPELFQYFRFSKVHPGAKEFINYGLPFQF